MRVLLAAALAAAAFATAPATAGGPGGYCDGTADVACREYPCQPDVPCAIDICVVWIKGDCVVG